LTARRGKTGLPPVHVQKDRVSTVLRLMRLGRKSIEVSGRSAARSPEVLGDFRVDPCPGRFCFQLPTGHTSVPLPPTARPDHDDGQGQPGFAAGSCRRRTKVTACYCRSQECSPFYPTRSCERTRIPQDESSAPAIPSAVRGEGLGWLHPGDVRTWNTRTEQVHTINGPQYHPP